MPKLEIWQWLAIGTVAMAIGWAVAILVWEPLGLVLVFAGFAIFVIVLQAVRNHYMDKYRRR